MLQWFERWGEREMKSADEGLTFPTRRGCFSSWEVQIKYSRAGFWYLSPRNKTKQRLSWEEEVEVREEGVAGGGHSTILKFPMHSISVRNLMVVFTFSPWMFSLKALL